MESPLTSRKPHSFAECQRVAAPMTDMLSSIGGKWSLFVIMALMQGPARFSELRRSVEGISQKMLTQTLRELEEDGLVRRTVTPIIPPRVDYELTDLGHELDGPINALAEWTERNRSRIEAARAAYAERRAA
jgi:DNA-binding HxlR family transcriptional regulator